MRDEQENRQDQFRPGRPIQLADGQTWILPAPLTQSEWRATPFGDDYSALIRAILEAEDRSEQRLAELAFAIHLLAYNYRLEPADYERLLESGPAATGAGDWQIAFHEIAQDHVRSFVDNAPGSGHDRCASERQRSRFSLLAWLREHLLPAGFPLK